MAIVGAFKDILLVITDNGDGTLHVQNGPEGFTISMQDVDDIINGIPDPTQAFAFNFAARLAASGIARVQTAPGSGVADPAALTILNAVSFKGY